MTPRRSRDLVLALLAACGLAAVPALVSRAAVDPGAGPDAARAANTRPIVFLPGIAGSVLVDAAGSEYWPAAGYGGHDKLTLYPSQPHPALHASGVVTEARLLGIHIPAYDDDTYGPLLSFLQRSGFPAYQSKGDPARLTAAGCDTSQAARQPLLFVFPYDWRLSNAANAQALADYIACVRKIHPGTDVNLVSHSMGSLVARRYILDHPGGHHVHALVTFGAPWLGSGKLGWVMETGEFVFFVWDSTLVNAIGSFTGAHELLTSQAWYELGGAPAIVEDGQDLNRNGIDREPYAYADLVAYMDRFKGQEGFLPGTANRLFHAFGAAGSGQDDWRNDATGVQYFHILGVGGVPDTISQVVATTFLKCAQHFTTCHLSTWEYPQYDVGDQTVPLLSLSRDGGARGNYNAPGATVYACRAGGANSAFVRHTSMMSNPVLQGLLLQYLDQANGAPARPPPDPLACGRGGSAGTGPAQGYHQLLIDGATDLAVRSADPPDAGQPFDPDVAAHRMSPTATQLVLADGAYTVTFRAAGGPTYVEWLYGSGGAPTDAVRYLDTPLPAGRSVQLRLTAGELAPLRVDADGDGSWDSTVQATFDLEGRSAADENPPRLTIRGVVSPTGVRITIAGEDDAAGLEEVAYSFDGTSWEPYTGPFDVDPGRVRSLMAVAQDRVGNRSSPTTYILPVRQLFLPALAKPMTVAAAQGPGAGTRHGSVGSQPQETVNSR